MTGKEFIQFHKDMMVKMNDMVAKKNHDYSNGGTEDAFLNFKVVEKMGICSAEQGFLTRMSDKMCRINSFVQQGTLQVQDEKIADTLEDLANYAILFAAFLKAKKDEAKVELPKPFVSLNN